MLNRIGLLLALVLTPLPVVAQDRVATALEARLFPDLAQRIGSQRAALAADATLRRLAETRRARLADAATCSPRPACILDRHLLTGADIATIDAALTRLAPVADRQAWPRAAAAINQIIGIYGKGEAPRYPKIDAMTLDPAAPEFAGLMVTLDDLTRGAAPAAITEPLRFAIGLLDLNGRDEAIRYGTGPDAAVLAVARKIDWRAAPYSAIVVPGAGPDDPGVALSAFGKLRLALAVERFRAGDAPFILVSGGNVHPNRTPFNEAVEMRRELIDRFGIPADRIVLEPYARHTTTNLRNAARLLAAMRAPAGKPTLIVTDRWQSAYIASDVFTRRNIEELGFQPGTLGKRESPTALPFVLSPASLAVDPRDPLDP
jgi:hypothetical protein